MALKDIQFKLKNVDPSGARLGQFTTAHGTVQTPSFMVVGTSGYVRSVTPRDVAETGTQVVLANTYHLSSSERLKTIQRAGGIHRLMGWDQTILTDSGGFQVFSLPDKQITDEGVSFAFTENGERLFLSPERSMEIQKTIGADIVMAFDECAEHTASREYIQQSVARTTRWAKQCREVKLLDHQFLFGIVQGGIYPDLRKKSAAEITAIPFDGFAIGGVSVGEGHELMAKVVSCTVPLLPADKPRYLMGVGTPEDLFAAIERGIDMFDCIIPTRYGRHGTLFTRTGKMRVMDRTYAKDLYPPDTQCNCYTCKHYSRMVLHYLFFTRDSLAQTLGSIHNITLYQDLMKEIRNAIEKNQFSEFKEMWLKRYRHKAQKKLR